MVKSILLVGLGGGVGSVFRYLTSVVVCKYVSTLFPWATLVANVLGCFLIGLLMGLLERQALSNPDMRFLLVTGFCGGYTTFSTFAYENMTLLQSDHSFTAFLYIGASVLAGLMAVWLGLALVKI